MKHQKRKKQYGRALLVKGIKNLNTQNSNYVDSNTAEMDIDNILTMFIMIMFQRILNKLDEVEAFFVV